MRHFIRRCEICKCVILQCRCPSPVKPVEWGICHKCAGGDRVIESVKRGMD